MSISKILNKKDKEVKQELKLSLDDNNYQII